MKIGRSKEDKAFDIANTTLLVLILIIVAYPLYFVIIASFSDPLMTNSGKVWFIPRGITLKGYEKVFEESRIWQGFFNSVIYTVLGVIAALTATLPAAYTLSRKNFVGRKVFSFIYVFTMLFSGGMVSTYLIVTRTLGQENTIWAMILPQAVSAYYLIIARTFMESSVPEELRESAHIDGCSEFRFFFKIVLPLSIALIATLVLMFGVLRWNSYTDALLYLTEPDRFSLQVILRELLIQETMSQAMDDGASQVAKAQMADLLKFSIIIVSSIPLIMVYPFIQKYLIRGMLVGAIKG